MAKGVPSKSQGKTTVINMKSAPKTPRMTHK